MSGSRKRYFTFECDLTFTEGRIQIGNDVQRIWRPAPSPRYEGFVELAESTESLNAPAPASLLDALLIAIDTGQEKLVPLDEATRALNLGLAIVRAAESPGNSITPADLSRQFHVASV